MDEYIKRESFMKRFCERCNEEMSEIPCEPSDCFAREVIKTFPAADVAPVRHGKWIEQEKYTFGVMYDCSICDNRILDNGHSWNYCPNCGSLMDKEE